jgi:hypothetical protein
MPVVILPSFVRAVPLSRMTGSAGTSASRDPGDAATHDIGQRNDAPSVSLVQEIAMHSLLIVEEDKALAMLTAQSPGLRGVA